MTAEPSPGAPPVRRSVLVIAGPGEPAQRLRTALDAGDSVNEYRLLRLDAEPVQQPAADAAVLLTPILRRRLTPDLDLVERFFDRGGAAAARQWTVVASATIGEPGYRKSGMIGEESVSQPATNPVARAWTALEDLVRDALPPPLTILRPAALADAEGEDLFSQLLSAKVATVVAGFNPTLQLLTVTDLAAAVSHAIEQPRDGVFNVAPAAAVPLHRALELAGTARLPLPGPLHRLLRPAGETAYLRYPWTVSGDRIRQRLGFIPKTSSAAAAVGGADPGPPDDDWGMDRGYIAAKSRGILRFLHDRWWRVETRGLEHIPRVGGAVLVGVHRGHQPWDGAMVLHLVYRELGRVVRFLTHPTLLKFPFITPFMGGLGGVPAFQGNADKVLADGHLLGIFPEGIRGAFRLYHDVYRLGSFGRHDFVKLALRYRVPIIPFVTVGSAEVFPILGKIHWRWWRRWSEWPFLPITPTMSLIPLPSKWHTLFLEPIDVDELPPPSAVDDAATVSELSREVKRRLQKAMDEMRRRRRSIWYGSIFEPPSESR